MKTVNATMAPNVPAAKNIYITIVKVVAEVHFLVLLVPKRRYRNE